MQIESRRLPAFACCANAVLIRLPQLYEVTLIDISAHAALVAMKGRAEIKPGDQARLRVLTEKGNQAFEVQARVAHRSQLGVGLEIGAIDQHARNRLQRLIGVNPGAPELAARTLADLVEAHSLAHPAPALSAAQSARGSGRGLGSRRALTVD